MPEIIGIDPIYVTVSDVAVSEKFYDTVMAALGFKKNRFPVNDEKHIQYYNCHFGYVLRPARLQRPHDAYAPGLHHLCFRVDGKRELQEAARKLTEAGVAKPYAEYASDYFAFFFLDRDGLRLEITHYRLERRQRHDDWESPAS